MKAIPATVFVRPIESNSMAKKQNSADGKSRDRIRRSAALRGTGLVRRFGTL